MMVKLRQIDEVLYYMISELVYGAVSFKHRI